MTKIASHMPVLGSTAACCLTVSRKYSHLNDSSSERKANAWIDAVKLQRLVADSCIATITCSDSSNRTMRCVVFGESSLCIHNLVGICCIGGVVTRKPKNSLQPVPRDHQRNLTVKLCTRAFSTGLYSIQHIYSVVVCALLM